MSLSILPLLRVRSDVPNYFRLTPVKTKNMLLYNVKIMFLQSETSTAYNLLVTSPHALPLSYGRLLGGAKAVNEVMCTVY